MSSGSLKELIFLMLLALGFLFSLEVENLMYLSWFSNRVLMKT